MAHGKALRRKQQGKCVRCGVEDAPLGGATCLTCVETMTTAKQTMRSQGICVNCWKAPARPQRRYCVACTETMRQRTQKQYAARKQAGLCVQCGKHPFWHGRTTCEICWAKKHRRTTFVSPLLRTKSPNESSGYV